MDDQDRVARLTASLHGLDTWDDDEAGAADKLERERLRIVVEGEPRGRCCSPPSRRSAAAWSRVRSSGRDVPGTHRRCTWRWRC